MKTYQIEEVAGQIKHNLVQEYLQRALQNPDAARSLFELLVGEAVVMSEETRAALMGIAATHIGLLPTIDLRFADVQKPRRDDIQMKSLHGWKIYFKRWVRYFIMKVMGKFLPDLVQVHRGYQAFPFVTLEK